MEVINLDLDTGCGNGSMRDSNDDIDVRGTCNAVKQHRNKECCDEYLWNAHEIASDETVLAVVGIDFLLQESHRVFCIFLGTPVGLSVNVAAASIVGLVPIPDVAVVPANLPLIELGLAMELEPGWLEGMFSGMCSLSSAG